MTPHERRLEADAAKASMLGEIQQLKARLSPARLTESIKENAQEKASDAVEAVRRKPALAGSVAAGAALFLFRKRLCRMFGGRSKDNDRDAGQSKGTLS
jgi:putative heme iron utilization protein